MTHSIIILCVAGIYMFFLNIPGTFLKDPTLETSGLGLFGTTQSSILFSSRSGR